MSQQPTQTIVIEQRSNGLGTAGFVISLLGFLTCGLICPLGLLVSLFGLLFRPRGLAAAGCLLGAIGSLWLWVAGLGIVAGLVHVGAAVDRAAKQAAKTPAPTIVEIEGRAGDQPHASTATGQSAATVEEQTASTADAAMPPAARTAEAAPEPQPRDLRVWTDATGKFSIEARLVSVLSGKATLAKPDGSEIAVEIAKLSDSDQRYISAEMRE